MRNVPQLQTNIRRLVDGLAEVQENPAAAREQFAQGLAQAIDEYVAQLQVPAGIPVSTAGTATAQTGATTAPINLI